MSWILHMVMIVANKSTIKRGVPIYWTGLLDWTTGLMN